MKKNAKKNELQQITPKSYYLKTRIITPAPPVPAWASAAAALLAPPPPPPP